MGKLQGRCKCRKCVRMDDGFWRVTDEAGYTSDWWPDSCIYCWNCGSRLNADGTADDGEAAWKDHEAMEALREITAAADFSYVELAGTALIDGRTEWHVLIENMQGDETFAPENNDPADAILAVKSALEASDGLG